MLEIKFKQLLSCRNKPKRAEKFATLIYIFFIKMVNL